MFKIVVDAISEHGSMEVDLPRAPPPFRFADQAEEKCAFRARIPGYRLRGAHRHLARPGRAGRARLDL